MKILYITPYYYPNLIGGSERSLKILAEGVASRGFEVSVLSFDGVEKKKTETLNGVKVTRVKKPNWKPNTIAVNLSLLLNKQLVKEENPDIIHVYNTWHIPASYFLKKYAPVFATLNNYYPICATSYTLNNIIEKGKIDIFNMVRGIYITLDGSVSKRLLAAIGYTIYSKIVIRLSKKIDMYITYADSVRDIYIKNGFDKNKIHTTSGLFEVKKDTKIKTARKNNVVLYVGGLMKPKGILELLEAFELLKDKEIELRIVGGGLLKDRVREIIKKKKLNAVSYGRLKHDELKKHYMESTVLVHPSHWPEPFSRVWIEALENEIPIISADNPVAKEILHDGAVFYRRDHPEELAEKIMDVLNGKIKIDQTETRKRVFSKNPTNDIISLYKNI